MRGRNFFPHEIERSVEQIESIRKGGAVVFAADEAPTDRLIAVCEVDGDVPDPDSLIVAIRRMRGLTEKVTSTISSSVGS